VPKRDPPSLERNTANANPQRQYRLAGVGTGTRGKRAVRRVSSYGRSGGRAEGYMCLLAGLGAHGVVLLVGRRRPPGRGLPFSIPGGPPALSRVDLAGGAVRLRVRKPASKDTSILPTILSRLALRKDRVPSRALALWLSQHFHLFITSVLGGISQSAQAFPHNNGRVARLGHRSRYLFTNVS